MTTRYRTATHRRGNRCLHHQRVNDCQRPLEPSVIGRHRSGPRPATLITVEYLTIGPAKGPLWQRFSVPSGWLSQTSRRVKGREARPAPTGPPVRAAVRAVPGAGSPANPEPEFTHSPITAGGLSATPGAGSLSAHAEPPTFVDRCSGPTYDVRLDVDRRGLTVGGGGCGERRSNRPHCCVPDRRDDVGLHGGSRLAELQGAPISGL